MTVATHELNTFVKSCKNQIPYDSWKDFKIFLRLLHKKWAQFLSPIKLIWRHQIDTQVVDKLCETNNIA